MPSAHRSFVADRAHLVLCGVLVAALLAGCEEPPEVVEPGAGAGPSGEPAPVTTAGDAAAPAAPAQGSDQVEPYVVKGRVLDAQGTPMAGVEVGADDTLLYDSNALGITDAEGYYRIDLSGLETTWRMWGYHDVEFDGQHFTFDLAVDRTPFASAEGAVRDLTWHLSGPHDQDPDLHYGGSGWVYEDLDTYDIEDWGLVTLRLVPAGPLVDGSAGQSLEVQPDQGGALTDIPIGRYTVTATYDGQSLLVRPRNEGDFASSAEGGFVAATTAGTMELEVRLP